MKKLSSAFTLVELIIVIAVLAVLATISFSTVGNISSGARDSARLTDISSIKTSLEQYNATKWGYPIPDNATTISWSGNLAWSQGTFGENTARALGTISRPKDPKWNVDYSYSVSNSKKEYEIATVLEKATTYNNRAIENTYAQGEQYEPIIKGNYNGVALQVASNLSTWILSVPTLIASDIKDAKLENVVFSYSKSKNLPFNYSKSVASSQAVAVTWTPKQVWSGAINSISALPKSDSELQQLTADLKTAYSASPAANNETIKSLLATTDTKGYGNIVVNNVWGGKKTFPTTPQNQKCLSGSLFESVAITSDMNSGDSFTRNVIAAGYKKATVVSCANGILQKTSEISTPIALSCPESLYGVDVAGNPYCQYCGYGRLGCYVVASSGSPAGTFTHTFMWDSGSCAGDDYYMYSGGVYGNSSCASWTEYCTNIKSDGCIIYSGYCLCQ